MTKNATMTAAGAVGAMRGRGGIATILGEELDANLTRPPLSAAQGGAGRKHRCRRAAPGTVIAGIR